MIVLRILRPDRYLAKCQEFVKKVIGEIGDSDVDLGKIVEKESNSKSPILLVSAPGFDASYKVDNLAKSMSKKYTSVAIGSPEAFE